MVVLLEKRALPEPKATRVPPEQPVLPVRRVPRVQLDLQALTAQLEASRQAEAAAGAAAARLARRHAAEGTLPAEAAAAGECTHVVVRCPDGSRVAHRFARDAPLGSLFALVEARWHEPAGAELLPTDFRLVASFPRRTLTRTDAAGATLESAGFGGAQEALFLEWGG